MQGNIREMKKILFLLICGMMLCACPPDTSIDKVPEPTDPKPNSADSGERLDTTRRHPKTIPDETPPGGG